MLKDKGVEEFVQAARKLKSKLPNVEFALLGPLDSQNSNAISSEQMEAWVNEGLVSYWGKSKDVRNEICRADCVVLPSYREGTPRALLEAAAMGRVLIATDVPGCREIVRHEFNGLLCKSRNVDDLAQSMVQLINLPLNILMEWGKNSRLLVEQNFDERFVIEKYIKAIDSLC
jgi:glycosyltransferase involved in cell wall biosynthesis